MRQAPRRQSGKRLDEPGQVLARFERSQAQDKGAIQPIAGAHGGQRVRVGHAAEAGRDTGVDDADLIGRGVEQVDQVAAGVGRVGQDVVGAGDGAGHSAHQEGAQARLGRLRYTEESQVVDRDQGAATGQGREDEVGAVVDIGPAGQPVYGQRQAEPPEANKVDIGERNPAQVEVGREAVQGVRDRDPAAHQQGIRGGLVKLRESAHQLAGVAADARPLLRAGGVVNRNP